ncbi:MAG: transposase [Phycisphaerae bacterium]|nr:transposase [Phycisphaerae bacterium]
MKYLDMKLSKASVWRIMVDHGFNPDSEVRNSGDWEKFIKSHFGVLAATDFFTIELLTCKGLVRCMVLFVIDIATRRVHIAGIRINPDGQWTEQIARNLTDYENGFLNGKKYLIHDRDLLFTKKFDDILGAVGVTSVKTVKRSPNLNAYAERFVQTIKKECLNHLILTNEEQLKYAVDQFIEHYNHERPHENLDGKMIDPLPQDDDGEIIRFERLGGLLKSYRRIKQAA